MGKELDDILKNASLDVIALNPELGRAITRAEALKISVETLHKAEGERKPNKYGAIATERDGIRFDSRKEAQRYAALCQLERAGIITNLRRQVAYELQPAFETREGERVRAITYIGDFEYMKDGFLMIEDTKSIATRKNAAFRIKWRLLQYKYRDQEFVKLLVT